MTETGEGQARLKRQVDRENEYISRLMEKQDGEEQAKKKVKPDIMASPEGGLKEYNNPWKCHKYQKYKVVPAQAETALLTATTQSARRSSPSTRRTPWRPISWSAFSKTI